MTAPNPAARLLAPWTPDQVGNINAYQLSGVAHPFTCGRDDCLYGDAVVGGHNRAGRTVLLATMDGWECPACGWTQDWALTFMADRSWEQPGPWPLIVMTTAGDGQPPPRPRVVYDRNQDK
jgi:hypothetical protein